MDTGTIHDLNNDLTILMGLVSRLEENELVERIVKVIDRIKDKVQDVTESKEEVNVNKVLNEIKEQSSNLKVTVNSLSSVSLKLNKNKFEDMFNNFIKNSAEAGATEATIEIRDYSIIYKDNGKCSQDIVDSLNNGSIKSSKGANRGVGSKNIAKFCQKNNLKISYYLISYFHTNKTSLGIKLLFP